MIKTERLVSEKSSLLKEENAQRIFGIDLVRSAAILFVLISHSRHFLENYFGKWVKYLSVGGFIGVELFFVLSGFLIGGILIKIIDTKKRNFGIKEIKHFWIRRWYRTLPNYYLLLVINAIIVSFINGRFTFNIKYAFFVQNFLSPLKDDMNYAQSWSLTIEEWFYIFIPFFFLAIIKISKGDIKKTLLYAIGSVLILYPVFKFVYVELADFFFNTGRNLDFFIFRQVTILRFDSLLFGVLAAYFDYYYRDKVYKFRSFLFLCGSIVLLLCTSYAGAMIHFDITKPGIILNIFFTSFTSLSIALMLPYFKTIKVAKNNLFTKFITVTSLTSYSLYLIHWSIVIPFFSSVHLNPFVSFICFWLSSYFLSLLNYYYFEKRMTAIRERY